MAYRCPECFVTDVTLVWPFVGMDFDVFSYVGYPFKHLTTLPTFILSLVRMANLVLQ